LLQFNTLWWPLFHPRSGKSSFSAFPRPVKLRRNRRSRAASNASWLAVPLVTGIVDGLVNNLSGQKSDLTFTVTLSINTPSGGWDIFTRYLLGNGFDVSGGQIQGVNFGCLNSSGTPEIYLNNLNLSVQH
jgi:hypothetical protein